MTEQVIKVTQKEGEAVPTEILATEIIAISAGIAKLRSGRLSERALVLLIQDAVPADNRGQKISKTDIRAVLNGLADLEKTYVRKPAAK